MIPLPAGLDDLKIVATLEVSRGGNVASSFRWTDRVVRDALITPQA